MNSPRKRKKQMENLVDSFLYLGPQDLRLSEQIPADIVLDGRLMGSTATSVRRLRLRPM